MRVEVPIPLPEPGRLPDGLPNDSAVSGALFKPTIPSERKIARLSVLKAGFLGVLLEMVPLLGSVLTGILAVWFNRRAGGHANNAGTGARLGAAAAGLAFTISAGFTAIQVFVLNAQKETEEATRKLLEALGANLADPRIQEAIQRLFTPSGMALSFLFGLIIAVALGAFGGAVAAASRPRPRV